MKIRISHLIVIALTAYAAAGMAFPAYGQEPVPRSEYLAYARDTARWAWDHYDELLERWEAAFDPENVFGYRPPGGLLEMAVIFAHLYELEQTEEYAERAKKVLLTYRDFRSIYPQWATDRRADYDDAPPPLPDFFTVMRYIRAYVILKPFGVFSPAEHTIITETIADSMAYLLRSQEWGPMNRTALRAESLAWAVRALPDHPKAPEWEMLRRALGDDNWGNWEIEDATIYHGVWLYALCGYAYAQDRMQELFKTPEMYYYAQYFLHLMSPSGMIPDFGDAQWNSNWNRYLVYFEAAAALYRDPELKWAASSIARRFIDFSQPRSLGLAYIFLDCYLWGSDEIPAAAPSSLSKEVMEDVQGKKIVFRSGWQDDSTYLLLNYRDEGDGGLNFRDYLRDTIPVEEEKMTHGHADENSLVLLMSGGSVLLHDGGYRDYMPSGPLGAYRQDYFHNRLCVRAEKIFMGQNQGEFRYSIRDAVPGQKVLDFLHNAGSYRIVRTQKIDFITLPDFDYSRTRLIDDSMGYAWDRVIAYIKDPELFVVFDIFKARQEDFFTLANLWHTRRIIKQGEHWYDTFYDRIQKQELPQDKHLLIVFPLTQFRLEGVEQEMRHYQEELVIHQTTAQHFELGETVGLVTVLVPHSAAQPPEALAERIAMMPVDHPRAGMGVRIEAGDRSVFIGVKNDLRMDMIRDWRRPRYTYESGKIAFGDFETNGDFLFASLTGGRLDYTIVNLTKALYKGNALVDVMEGFFGLAFDASPDQSGKGKLRYWRDSVEVGH
jgi:hypothetical protein